MLKSALLAWGFVNSKSDTSLFIYRNGHSIVLLLIYVDDVILTGNNKLLLTEFVTALDKRFALKYLDHLNYFLGISL
ncbi:reverse transcriptase domain-containing protein, partial [Acinetobacter baylyi]|uniref:reverse transcriptase domain-containing protein n=1 Tax=Acinetobacter baylyi TaxID=202950 RepID=UPI0013D7323F